MIVFLNYFVNRAILLVNLIGQIAYLYSPKETCNIQALPANLSSVRLVWLAVTGSSVERPYQG